MAPKREKEVIVHRDVGVVKGMSPRLEDELLGLVAGRDDRARGRSSQQFDRARQLLAIDFTAGHAWQFLDHVEKLRYHVWWEFGPQMLSDSGAVGFSASFLHDEKGA